MSVLWVQTEDGIELSGNEIVTGDRYMATAYKSASIRGREIVWNLIPKSLRTSHGGDISVLSGIAFGVCGSISSG